MPQIPGLFPGDEPVAARRNILTAAESTAAAIKQAVKRAIRTIPKETIYQVMHGGLFALGWTLAGPSALKTALLGAGVTGTIAICTKIYAPTRITEAGRARMLRESKIEWIMNATEVFALIDAIGICGIKRGLLTWLAYLGPSSLVRTAIKCRSPFGLAVKRAAGGVAITGALTAIGGWTITMPFTIAMATASVWKHKTEIIRSHRNELGGIAPEE